eukprot:Phypoly_transcript_05687.p1 GENE.Phypoly_transcript_05687~~Phypoly_transcript_05687.p1  ORF type:complete len:630 (+),score=112.13 Phypoly_transcript_05687:80-1891(+)
MNFRLFPTLLSRKPSAPVDPATPSPKEEKGYDHVVFLVHGIGEHEEKWKVIVPKLERCYKKVENYMGVPVRVKWIPIEWHSVLHTQTDEHVTKVTPKGMTGPRSFINNTLIDILFWASPYGQTIITEVGQQLNQQYSQFKKDYPDFSGDFSIYAHSLGSIICYDLLSHQAQPPSTLTTAPTDKQDTPTLPSPPSSTVTSPLSSPRSLQKPEGNVATWQRLSAKPTTPPTADQLPGDPPLKFPLIEFEIENFFMVGSPTGIFLTARGADYPVRLPKCSNIYNIYNPNDPVSYLIEPLVDPGFVQLPTCPVPHIPDSTEVLKGAVARGSKSLFSFNYKSTTTTTTTSPNSSTTTTTTVTKEVVPNIPTSPTSSSGPASTVSSPTILAGAVYAVPANNFVFRNQIFSAQKAVSNQLSNYFQTFNNHTTFDPHEEEESEFLICSSGTSSPQPEVAEVISFEEMSVNDASVVEALGIVMSGGPSLSPRSETSSPPILERPPSLILPSDDKPPGNPPSTPTNSHPTIIPPSSPINSPLSTPSTPTTPGGPANVNGNGSDKTFFDGVRYDFKLQQSGIVENLSEYAALLNAHRCYWYSKDAMLFVLQKLL